MSNVTFQVSALIIFVETPQNLKLVRSDFIIPDFKCSEIAIVFMFTVWKVRYQYPIDICVI